MPADPSISTDWVLHPADLHHVVALSALDIFPRQLTELVFRFGASGAWQRVLAGDPGVTLPAGVARTWARRAARIDPPAFLAAHREAGIGISALGGPSYPEPLLDDIEAPIVVFHRGDPRAVEAPRVAIVGTRRATTSGRALATEWGHALSELGVCVVSGLALGIDAAAHEGALAGPTPPIAVVGSGLDVVYPRRNQAVWREVAERGLLLSEYPLGTGAAAAHFPARNRIIAALADVVVVIESHAAGGSLLTVGAAVRRERTVLAVPGSVHSPASRGTNALIRDGAGVACELDDILVNIGMSPGARRRARETRPAPDAVGATLLEAFGWLPATLESLALRTGVDFMVAADALERLVEQRWVHADQGWYERLAHDRPAEQGRP